MGPGDWSGSADNLTRSTAFSGTSQRASRKSAPGHLRDSVGAHNDGPPARIGRAL
jgi:hypothetical protein